METFRHTVYTTKNIYILCVTSIKSVSFKRDDRNTCNYSLL